ncbi:hypothetical protein [Caldimonas tepidiphila]|uniref:hypothetical protein n=1 Tax=Caldimonas tepidiphila TaxID=2315841 RepID=UPI000E5BB916|nr:hypothetical protein [Caldimonas tepidiphila]
MPHPARRPFGPALGAALLLLACLPTAAGAGDGPEPPSVAAVERAAGDARPAGAGRGEASRPRRLQEIASRGAGLREQGDLEAALAVLEQGHDEMLGRDEGAAPLQAYVDGLRLQAEYGMTLVQLGRVALGEEFIATARRTVELAHARRESEGSPDEASSRLAAAGLREGEALETALADFYARRIEAPVAGLDAQLASQRMIEASRRAESWVLRRALAQEGGDASGQVPAQRVADLRLALARALLAAGRREDAAAEFVAAAALSCMQGGVPGQQRCTRATLGWTEAAGATDPPHARWQEALGFDAAGPGRSPDP